METISVFEHQPLRVDGIVFKEKHRRALERFLGNNDETTFPYYSLIHQGVKFRQFVGVLCVNDLTIEVLPKTERDNNDKYYWRGKLIAMLTKIYRLDIKSPSDAPQGTKTNSAILDVFIKRFLNEVDSLLNRGLVKCYHKDEGNRNALKGKLLVSEQLRKNFIHQEQFYVRYNTYDYEHVMNCLLRQTIEVAIQATQNVYLKGRACSMLFNFPELKEVVVTPQLFDNLSFDRKTEDYRMAIKLAKLLLLHYVPYRVSKGDNILALMFDMNKLWEEYVYIILRHHLKDYEVRAQAVKLFWQREDGVAKKTIRPDIVIKKDDKVIAILDTKWKCPDKTPSDGDLHQMFVYSKMFNTNKVALAFPSTKENTSSIHAHFYGEKSSCDMLFWGIGDKDNNTWSNSSIVIQNWLEEKEHNKILSPVLS